MALTIENIALSDIYAFMESGNPKDAPEAVVQYLELLDKVRAMFLRIDAFGSKEAIVKHLIAVEKFSRYKASQICDDAQEYFYCDSNISKSAWRNIYADKIDKMINISMQHIKDVSDAQKVVKMLIDASVLRQVNVPDVEVIADEVFRKPVVIYSCDPKFLGLPEIDRNKLAKIIDELPELSEKERLQIRREARIDNLEIFPDEQKDARKS
jgi:hypothetical protein